MASGEHWEWRAFGSPTDELRGRFEALQPLFPPQDVTDRYVWMPGLRLNAKLREGVQEGLKLKRRLDVDGGIERWLEDPNELFAFPLDRRAWDGLALGLGLAGFEGAALPSAPTGLEESLELLGRWDAGVRVVEVRKRRESRRLATASGPVIVEWAAIDHPERTVSLGLEEWPGLGPSVPARPEGEAHPDGPAAPPTGLVSVREARDELRLEEEPLAAMSYLDAVAIWARGGRIGDSPPPPVGTSPGIE